MSRINYDEQILEDLYKEKTQNNLTWDEVAHIYNQLTNDNKSTGAIRKKFYRLTNYKADISDLKNIPENISNKIYKSDERAEINAIYRRISREQTIIEIAKDAAQQIANSNPFKYNTNSCNHTDDIYTATLLISDWHYGMHIDNPFNQYNEKIFKERLENLTDSVYQYISMYNLKRLNIFNLGDMIAGRIHNNIRIQNRIDVITQIIQVSEYIADFIYELSQNIQQIDYYDCLDNHSRLEPNLKDSLDLESLVRITHWFLVERFKDMPNVVIHENEFGENIISIKEFNHNIIAVHGHNDSPNRVIEDLSLLTRRSYDLVCAAHFHHFQADERNTCVFVANPSMMGTDEFAEKLRLTSKPAQTLIIHSEDNVVEGIHRILV